MHAGRADSSILPPDRFATGGISPQVVHSNRDTGILLGALDRPCYRAERVDVVPDGVPAQVLPANICCPPASRGAPEVLHFRGPGAGPEDQEPDLQRL